MKKIIIAALVLVLAFSTAVYAEPSQDLIDLRRQKDDINTKLKNIENDINTIESNMLRTQLTITELNEKLAVAYNDLEVITETLAVTRENLLLAEQDLQQAQDERDAQFEAYRERMKVMYMYGELSYLDVLFQATDIQDFLVRVQYLNTIAEHDQQMVDKLTAAEDKVEAKVEEIDRQEKTLAGYEAKQRELTVTYDAALKEQNDFLAGLESDLELTKQLQAQEEAERAVITANWREKENAYQAELERLAAERRAREEQERQVAIASFNGSFGWPVPSSLTISSHYGGRNHPVYGGWKHHSGVDISAGAGSDIKASESGVVTLSKWYSTYGNCVIISHGGGVQTLYAHASKLLVSEGQTVNKGDVIAKVGSTGVSTGNHLHFEIIINGKDVNPRPYLGY